MSLAETSTEISTTWFSTGAAAFFSEIIFLAGFSLVTDLLFAELSRCLTPLVTDLSLGEGTLLLLAVTGNCVTFSFELSFLTEDPGELFLSAPKFVKGLLLELVAEVGGFDGITLVLLEVGRGPGVFFDDEEGLCDFIDF